MQKVKKYLAIAWQIAKHFLLPELREYKYDIITDAEIVKMRHSRAASEYIRSRRRVREYSELVRQSFKRKYKLLVIFTIIISLSGLLIHFYKPNFIKLGDIIYGCIPFIWYLSRVTKAFFYTPIDIAEENISKLSLPALKKLLRSTLNNEWHYMDFHNKRMASSSAMLITFLPLLTIFFISYYKNNSSIDLLEGFMEPGYSGCETVDLLGIKFSLCDYFSGRFIYFGFAFIILSEIASVLSGLIGSGKFFRSQSFKPNFISSTYLDNISLSILNPNQHEAI